MTNSMLQDNKIVIVIPTYNEADNIARVIQEILILPLPNLKIIVVDDNSPDGTGEIADSMKLDNPERIDVLHRDRKDGLGKAYIAGIREALTQNAEIIGQMDADFSHPPNKIPEMVKCLENCDVVVGSRYVKGGAVDVDWPLFRKVLSSFGNFYARTILNIPVRDVTGGFRLFKNEALSRVPLDTIVSTGYVFMVELLYYVYLSNGKIREVPIYFKERSFGQSKMSIRIQIEASIRVWSLLLKVKRNNVRGLITAK